MYPKSKQREFTLVTGGLGYIGIHLSEKLAKNNQNVLIIDFKSQEESEKIFKSIPDNLKQKIEIENADLCDRDSLDAIFSKYKICKIYHLAALKSVSESTRRPELYMNNNVTATKNVLDKMNEYQIKRIIFSSSASVYGNHSELAIEETILGDVTSPYAQTKIECEKLIMNEENIEFTILRYFNPIGWTSSIPKFNTGDNLMESILSCIKSGARFKINGQDYDTEDGTPVRDYIHISDLIDAHLIEETGIFNIGSGRKTSVKEIVDLFELNYEMCDRRQGDSAIYFADISKVSNYWKPKKDLETIKVNLLSIAGSEYTIKK